MSSTLPEWLASHPAGRYALAREQSFYDQAVADVFGYNAVQYGMDGVDLLRNSRMPHRFLAGPVGGCGRLIADVTDLPLASQAIDLLLLPHVLEFCSLPHQALREAERVLRPEGHLMISVFNPHSLWGAKRWFAQEKEQGPWQGQFIALSRLKDWLSLLGFQIVAGRLGCYVPPFQDEKWLRRLSFLEKAGDRWWALGGGVYFLQAKKRVRGMRLIMPGWNDVRAVKQVLVPSAQKTGRKVMVR